MISGVQVESVNISSSLALVVLRSLNVSQRQPSVDNLAAQTFNGVSLCRGVLSVKYGDI